MGAGPQLGVVGDRGVAQPGDLRVRLLPAGLVGDPRLDPVDDVAGTLPQVPVARAMASSMPRNRMSSLAGNHVDTVRGATSARSAIRGIVAEA